MTHCEDCKGTGKVLISVKAGYGVCPICGGRGETYIVPKGDYSVILAFEKGRIKK